VTGTLPAFDKYVLIGAPHTRNWDFIAFLGVADAFGITPHFMAKTSLFRWPIGGFMRQMGGVPVDRKATGGMVEQMAARFAADDGFVLVIAPEGTRGAVDQWRTGFYRIAMAAKVPIVCAYVDYSRRKAGIGPAVTPSGDYEADLAVIHAFYRGVAERSI